jgi:16S rRNA (guanine(1405)-N(7))-methyltransferase
MSTSPDPTSQLDALVQAVLASPRYCGICLEVVRDVGARELAKRRKLAEAIKATKSKLHQIGGAYLGGRDYAEWLAALTRASEAGGAPALNAMCRQVMGYHASTRERLPILESFYTSALADLPPARVVLDLACGLNPLAIPLMPLAADVEYYAYDVYEDMADFLNGFLALAHIRGHAEARDVLRRCPALHADLALLLKALPCLEQLEAGAGLRLLEQVNADHLLVSFPARSLGGRKKGMAQNYEARFRQLVAGRAWAIKRLEFASEIAFLITKGERESP